MEHTKFHISQFLYVTNGNSLKMQSLPPFPLCLLENFLKQVMYCLSLKKYIADSHTSYISWQGKFSGSATVEVSFGPRMLNSRSIHVDVMVAHQVLDLRHVQGQTVSSDRGSCLRFRHVATCFPHDDSKLHLMVDYVASRDLNIFIASLNIVHCIQYKVRPI